MWCQIRYYAAAAATPHPALRATLSSRRGLGKRVGAIHESPVTIFVNVGRGACSRRCHWGEIVIYLMRHGADPSDRYGGWSAYGLTEKGREQVHSAKGNLVDKGITQIFSSDLVRAKETAEIVADGLSLEVTYLPQFRESNNGLLAGMLKTEAAVKYPGTYWSALDWTETWPEGESPEQFFHRIQKAWYEFKKLVGDNNVLLVSHGGVMNIILCLENGIPYTNKETHFPIEDAEIVMMQT